MYKKESYLNIRAITKRFQEVAKYGTIKVSPKQPVGIIISKKEELLAINAMSNIKGHAVMLFGIDDAGVLTVSFLGCNNKGEILDYHYKTSKANPELLPGQETWEHKTTQQIGGENTEVNDYFPALAFEDTDEKGVVADTSENADTATQRAAIEYDELVDKILSFKTVATPVFGNAKLGKFLSLTDLDRLKTLADKGKANDETKGLLMIPALEKTDDPSSLTVSFLAAELVGGTPQISDIHKNEGVDGEETWTISTDVPINGDVKKFLG